MGIEKTKWGKFQNNIYEHYLSYWNGVNTIIFALVGILFSLNREIFWHRIHSNTLGWVLLIIIILSSGLHIWRQVKNSKTIEKLEKDKNKEIQSLNQSQENLNLKIQQLESQLSKINSNSIEMIELNLSYLYERMKLNNNARITLYKFINDEFYVLGRYSRNDELKRRGRNSYKKEGLIFKAWLEEKFFKTTGVPLPFHKNGNFNKKYYDTLNRIAPIDKTTVLNMNMKSRSFYLKTLGNRLQNTSIIVIESSEENAFQENDINSVLNKDEQERLVTFVEKIDWVFPSINEAQQKGF